MSNNSVRNRTIWVGVAAVTVSIAAPQPSKAAGLFDFLFGGFNAPPPRYYDYGLPLDVRVHPERRRKPVANRSEPKAKLQTAIDPVKNPTWYLDDPTLRRGDIVVLKGRAVVYDGGRGERSMSDFTPVQNSKLVSRSERAKLDQMSRGNAGLSASVETTSSTPANGKEAALR